MVIQPLRLQAGPDRLRPWPGQSTPTEAMLDTLVQSWLTLQCQMIPNVAMGVAVLDVKADGAFNPAAFWPEGSSASAGLIASARLANTSNGPVVRNHEPDGPEAGGPKLDIACPLLRNGRLFGAVAVQTGVLPEDQQRAVTQLLQWGSAWLNLLLQPKSPVPDTGLSTVFDTVVAGLQHQGFEAAATAVATELAHQLSCQRVSLGFRSNKRVSLRAISHSANFESRSNLVRHIEAAMEEALALGATVVYPESSSESDGSVQAHAQLAREEGGEALCTVPLMGHDRPVGALTLERAEDKAFDTSIVALCEAVAAVVGPILEMKRSEDRPTTVRLKERVVFLLQRTFGPRDMGLKLGLATLAGLGCFLAFAHGEYRIAAPASLEGTVQRAVVAPFEGYIAAAHARAGEAVKAGSLLAELDDKDLRLERRRWTSEREEQLKEFRKALAELDHAQARILRAQVAQAEAQLELLDEQLARTRLVAPFDSVVISGDLSRSLGAPVARGEVLLEVAPLNAYRVVLEVDERDIPDVRKGQQGHLTLSAMPGERLPLVVENVSTISQTEEGNTAFRVEASLDGPPGHLRPGMRGIGKIVAGERKLAWIWTRRLVGWVQLWLWSWWP